jgi:predicted RNA-binding Zn ribbon-like protein
MRGSTTAETFRLGLGHPVLEFLATLAGRHRQPAERLAATDDLTRWLTLTGLAPDAGCTPQQLAGARDLREAIYRLLQAARTGRRPATRDISIVNEWARRPRPVPQLGAALRVHRRRPDPCTAALAELAASAIDLISGPEPARIRNCADPTCSLMFIDRSRPGRRRWCSMERCGNRAKTARYRKHRSRQSA